MATMDEEEDAEFDSGRRRRKARPHSENGEDGRRRTIFPWTEEVIKRHKLSLIVWCFERCEG
jgi:hypothetical protein